MENLHQARCLSGSASARPPRDSGQTLSDRTFAGIETEVPGSHTTLSESDNQLIVGPGFEIGNNSKPKDLCRTFPTPLSFACSTVNPQVPPLPECLHSPCPSYLYLALLCLGTKIGSTQRRFWKHKGSPLPSPAKQWHWPHSNPSKRLTPSPIQILVRRRAE